MRTTEQLYGINPEELRAMTYEEALNKCLSGAKTQLWKLMKPAFMDRDEPLIAAIHKSQFWCIAKLEELGASKTNKYQLFAMHIKLAFKSLLRR